MYIIIIGAIVAAGFSGYLFRLAIERIINEEIIITKKHPLSMIPPDILYILAVSIFIFIMSVGVVVLTINGST
ncbi:MAG: hypothetical protein J6M60_04595 [Clostridia bacterium]|nr:hypothetical protein [Clostridia bacterium]